MNIYRWDDVKEEHLLDGMLTRRVISGERVTMARIFLRKGCKVPMHSHENEQLTTVYTGALRFELGGKNVVVGPGETLHIPSLLPHSAEALEDTEEMDLFAPVRRDWLDGSDFYLRGKPEPPDRV
jgi:quercetin dioxygenase-like cupin family protein